jgi:hypothetical protein
MGSEAKLTNNYLNGIFLAGKGYDILTLGTPTTPKQETINFSSSGNNNTHFSVHHPALILRHYK